MTDDRSDKARLRGSHPLRLGSGQGSAADQPAPLRTGTAGQTRAAWYLEARISGDRTWAIPVTALPFRIGQGPDSHLTVPSEWASGRHAEIRGDGDTLTLVDLDSTNGTFLNGSRVEGETPLRAGDVLHVADFEMRVSRGRPTPLSRRTAELNAQQLPREVGARARAIQDLIACRKVVATFQPIVELRTGELAAIEALGRGSHPDLPADPASLFEIATRFGLGADLSGAFRRETFDGLMALVDKDLPPVFLNMHPTELARPETTDMLFDLRRSAPRLDLVLEIPEELLEEMQELLRIRTTLDQLGVRVAYDDFGVGQSRLIELAEAPPDFLKFDVAFIRGIDTAPPSKRRILTALVSAARELGAVTIAEGVETEAERDACIAVGFEQAQGYYYQAPTPLARLLEPPQPDDPEG